MKRYITFLSGYVLAVALCLQATGRFDCTNLDSEPMNLSDLKEKIKEYRGSGAWQQSIECTVEKAQEVLQLYVPVDEKKLAVVFDIDETALSNWDFFVTMDFGYNHDRYKDWEFSAKSKPILAIQSLYNFAKMNGFGVFFISGRRENQREATVRNLQRAGFNIWDGLFLKPMDYTGNKAADFKSQWREYIKSMGYTIVLNIGDQQSDLDGEPQALSNFKIANPVYIIP